MKILMEPIDSFDVMVGGCRPERSDYFCNIFMHGEEKYAVPTIMFRKYRRSGRCLKETEVACIKGHIVRGMTDREYAEWNIDSPYAPKTDLFGNILVKEN